VTQGETHLRSPVVGHVLLDEAAVGADRSVQPEMREQKKNKDERSALGSPQLLESGRESEVGSTEDVVSVTAEEGRGQRLKEDKAETKRWDERNGTGRNDRISAAGDKDVAAGKTPESVDGGDGSDRGQRGEEKGGGKHVEGESDEETSSTGEGKGREKGSEGGRGGTEKVM
jgi:hypothetical protein